jgi:tRNA1Val (adenine37-N6)-methyltransferase
MPNSYFQFKQFTIHQDKCAMKVCTDACIFGAWFARKELKAKKILDIGSGTGLLLLMLAQKHSSDFDGIEIDSKCFEQLRENVDNSKWREKVVVIEADVRNFTAESKFDFIISNPPFYERSLSSPFAESNLARHSSHLNLEELLIAIDRNLSSSGSFAVLLPYYRSGEFEELANANGFYLMEKLSVRQFPQQQFFRSIYHCSRVRPENICEVELVIQNDEGNYTEEFIELLKDYYLYLRPDESVQRLS